MKYCQIEAENVGPSVTHKKPMWSISCLLRAATDMEAETGCVWVRALAQFAVPKYNQAMNLNFPKVQMQSYSDSSDPCLFGVL